MKQIYKPNIVLWLEDDHPLLKAIRGYLNGGECIKDAFGGELELRKSDISKEVPPDQAEAEIERMINETEDSPTIINLMTAQLGRTFFEKYLPAAAISDSSFPLNGQKIIEWLCDHELEDYPLLCLTAKRWTDSPSHMNELPDHIKQYLAKTNSVYLLKASRGWNQKIENHIIFSLIYTTLTYGPKDTPLHRLLKKQ